MLRKQVAFDVTEDHYRLDRFLASHLTGVSRSYLQKLIREGLVNVNGHAVRPSHPLKAGDRVEVQMIPNEAPGLAPVQIPIPVIYEDQNVIVVDKPAGIPVHPGHGHEQDTLVNGLLARYPDLRHMEDQSRPGVVHRLDKDTSGVLIIARNAQTKSFLQAQFKNRTIKKVYLVLAVGSLTPAEGAIEAPIGRDPKFRRRMAVLKDNGKDAYTEYRVREYLDGYTLLEAYPRTGRTHQIRVHLAAIGHPVAGDTVYGRRRRDDRIPRQFLHAWRMTLSLPDSDKERMFEAPLPPDLCTSLVRLRSEGS